MTPKQKLRSQADKLWYRVYLKDYCEVCGKSGILQGHHFYYRSSYGHLRYNKDNHITLCRGCHFLLHHQDPKKIEEEIIKRRGQKWLNKLTILSKKRPTSFQTISWYKEQIAKLEREQKSQN